MLISGGLSLGHIGGRPRIRVLQDGVVVQYVEPRWWVCGQLSDTRSNTVVRMSLPFVMQPPQKSSLFSFNSELRDGNSDSFQTSEEQL